MLFEDVNSKKEGWKQLNPEILEIPNYITDNLKFGDGIFEWNKDAIENLLYYEHDLSNLRERPTHLMFNMATGSGKTLLMAAAILYYYQIGYKYFIFFVLMFKHRLLQYN